jgi:hypothetical protein
MQGLVSKSEGKAVCGVEKQGKGVEQIRAALLCIAKAWISQADLGNAKAWMRKEKQRHSEEAL